MSSGSIEICRPVSLDDWVLSPSIDFITLRLSSYEASKLRKALISTNEKSGTKIKVTRARTGPRISVITIHDPTVAELQQIIYRQWNAVIHEIEFTIDFRPKGEPAGLDELAPLYGWLRDCVFPPMPNARQKAYSLSTKKYELHGKVTNAIFTSRKWDNARSQEQIRLYIKSKDQGLPVNRPSVRLEVTWNAGACQSRNLSRVWQLVDFAPQLRKELSRYFLVAAGIKPKAIPVRHPDTPAGKKALLFNGREARKVEKAWLQHGAMWTVERGYQVHPHEEAAERIGDALSKLKTRLLKLKLPENSCRLDAQEPAEGRMVLRVDDFSTMTSIDAHKSQPKYLRKKPIPIAHSVPVDTSHPSIADT